MAPTGFDEQVEEELLELLPGPVLITEELLGENCVICQHALVLGDSTRPLHCGHSHWHESCLLQWLAEQRSCPICRAQLPGFQGPIDSATWLSDVEEVSASVESLEQRLEALEMQMRLRVFRERLSRRLEALERERQSLEVRVRSIGLELESFGTQLEQLHDERLALHRALLMARGGQTDAPLSPRRHDEEDAEDVEEKDDHDEDAQDEEQTKEEKAQGMLSRLRGAVLRTPLPAAEVFRSLAGSTGRLSPEQAKRVFRGLEESIPSAVLARVFAILDVDGSGFVEEADWMAALQLPRMGPARPAGQIQCLQRQGL